jgi:hypothetical protein
VCWQSHELAGDLFDYPDLWSGLLLLVLVFSFQEFFVVFAELFWVVTKIIFGN